jgi:succinoglycan biosynthesis transport protein ExoP
MENELTSGVPIGDYWRILLRRKWWFIVPLVLAGPIGYVVGFNMPKVYMASTVIVLEPPDIPQEYVMDPDSNYEVRLTRIKREILSDAHIKKISDELNLLPQNATAEQAESVADWLRANLQVNVTRFNWLARGRKQLDTFAVNFEGEDPKLITQIDNRFAELFVEENQKRREKYVESTATVLESELDNLRKKLEQQEIKISNFKRQYMGELPEQLGGNLSAKERYQQELRVTADKIEKLEDQRNGIISGMSEIDAGVAGSHALEARLQTLKDKLLNLQTVFTESYPDVIATKGEIKALERQILEKREADKRAASSPGVKPDVNPEYDKLKGQLATIDSQIKDLREHRSEVTKLVAHYQDRVDKAPVREQELLALQRDYDNTRSRYDNMLDKKLKVEISENIQNKTEGDEFKILEPAKVPDKPVRPDLLNIILMSLLFGAGGGVGLVLMAEYADSSFHKTDELEKATGLRVLCTIPKFTPEQEKSVNDWSRKRIPPSLLINDSQSLAAEQYRILCGKVQQKLKNTSGKVLGLTSAVLGEGKSTTAINLAVAFGLDFRKKTLLIDADLHRPGPSWIVGEKTGLANVLSGKADLSSALIGIPSYNLTILPKGEISRINPVEILGTNGIQSILDQVRDYYDFIIVDCPPVLQVASTNLVIESLDAILMVVRANATPRALVLKAEGAVQNQNIAGIVFNHADQSEMPSKYYYYSTTYSHV